MTWRALLNKLKDPRNVFAGALVLAGALQAYSEAIVAALGPRWSGILLAAIGVAVRLLPWLEQLAQAPDPEKGRDHDGLD